MRKLFKLLLVAALGFGITFGGVKYYESYSKLSKLEAKESIKQSLVKVIGKNGYGSGVIIQSTKNGSLILTNKHVCNINKLSHYEARKRHFISKYSTLKIKKVYEDDKKEFIMLGQVLKFGINVDLCLIHANKGCQPYSKLADKDIEWGEEVYGFSNPRGLEAVSSTGMALDFMYVWDMLYRQSTVLAIPGSSGSGVFNAQGELVGLISLTDGWYSYYVPHQQMKTFVAGAYEK